MCKFTDESNIKLSVNEKEKENVFCYLTSESLLLTSSQFTTFHQDVM